MKKIIIICALFILAFIIFIQCGGKGEEGVVLQYWDTQPDLEPTGRMLHNLIKKFDEEHPELKVQIQYIFHENFDDKLKTSILGKSPPDVVLMDRFVTSSYADNDSLIPLDNFIKKDNIKANDYFENCWNECVYNGKVWSIPHHTDIRMLYYREEDFREVGLDPDKPPKTWEQVFEYAKKLTKKNDRGVITRVGFVPDWGNSFLHLFAWANGGEFMRNNRVSCNEPQVVDALKWIVKVNDWYGRENVMASQQGFGSREMDPFIMGKLSMIIDGDYYVGILKEFGPNVKFRICPPPAPKGKPNITWSGGWALAVPYGAQYPEEAWKLIKYLSAHEAQVTYATQASRIPALKKAAKDPFFRRDKYYSQFIKMMKHTRYRPVTPVAMYYWDQVRRALELSVLHKKTPKQALDEAAKNTEKFLKEHKSKKKE